jgi:hypothetical protein
VRARATQPPGLSLQNPRVTGQSGLVTNNTPASMKPLLRNICISTERVRLYLKKLFKVG